MRTSKNLLRAFMLALFVVPITTQGCGDDLTTYRCFAWPDTPGDDPNTCPPITRATEIISRETPSDFTILGEGLLENGRCCYEVEEASSGCNGSLHPGW
ncbi:hypothetical protein [Polyangium sorediatum]|uniref:Uncharacterized protein n=1 Tax=Polyangium sorediatum TaxID=889274 RepID=A0ABT6P3M5_9BACT|nr:hypothetical protein [Polyangium sorediatum]MDI1435144.1 hypothetical protein [Polyangium sorediatum]